MSTTPAAITETKSKRRIPIVDLTEKCTKCGAELGAHDGAKCPPIVGERDFSGRLVEPLPPAAKASPAPVQTSAQGDLRQLAVADLVESPHNPRKSTQGPDFAELVESVRLHGVFQSLLVRPLGKGFEVVAGARRLAAARAARRETVPCVVRQLTDQQAEELALVENCKRVDLTALEEAEGYRRLMKEHGYTLSLLAERVSKPKSTVAGRVKLGELIPEGRKLLVDGHLSASVAELVARYPTKEVQGRALELLKKEAWNYGNRGGDDLSVIPVREARELLDAEFNLKLSSAGFDVKSGDLVPDAGACLACPKRTGAAPDRFEGLKGDTCLDSACWETKLVANHKLRAAELAAKGQKLLPAKEAEKVLSEHGEHGISYSARDKYAGAGEKAVGEKTWKQLLGDKTPTVVAVDDKGRAHHLVDKKAAAELLKAEDPKAAAKLEKPDASMDRYKKQEAAERRKRAARERVKALVGPRIIAALSTAKKYDTAFWRVLGRVVLAGGYTQAASAKKLEAAKTPPAVIALLVAELLEHGGGYYAEKLDALGHGARYAGVDVKKLQAKALKASKGTCWVCGCGEETPCKGGCAWADEGETLCTKCAGEK